MITNKLYNQIQYKELYPLFLYTVKWLVLSICIGSIIGSASALFLLSLDWVTNYRESHTVIIWLLPIAGLIIGLTYLYIGNSVVKGNNQILEEFYTPQQKIPFRMAPLIFFGTIITHLFGGSAGREGTAVQMGAAIADQFRTLFRLKQRDRNTILILGVSAGFASVFGTPIAGAVFAIEVMIIGRMRYDALLPSIMVALVAHYVCTLFPVHHTQNSIVQVPIFSGEYIFWILLCGVIFGVTARLFSLSVSLWTIWFAKFIAYTPLRPFFGGIILAIVVYSIGTTKYIGLGIPTIQASFTEELFWYDFILKLLFTAFTLGAGFKGGEVTPLFFIGAALGNVLSLFVPLPFALLAGMGFVAVFAGATNTPIACAIMGIELFGIDAGIYIALACITAYIFSGHSSIYSSQIIGSPKHALFIRKKGTKINQQ